MTPAVLIPLGTGVVGGLGTRGLFLLASLLTGGTVRHWADGMTQITDFRFVRNSSFLNVSSVCTGPGSAVPFCMQVRVLRSGCLV